MFVMKCRNVIVLAASMLCTSIMIHAQSMKNMIKLGIMGAVSVPANNAAAAAGVDISYQNLVTPNFGFGLATGYHYHFGKENTVNNVKLDNNSFGVVPVAALIRYYPKAEGIYVGTDLGYGFITGNENVAGGSGVYNAEKPGGGFYLKPEVGYHNRNWNLFAQYAKIFTGDEGTINVGSSSQKYNAGIIGVGFAYNIGLGAGR